MDYMQEFGISLVEYAGYLWNLNSLGLSSNEVLDRRKTKFYEK